MTEGTPDLRKQAPAIYNRRCVRDRRRTRRKGDEAFNLLEIRKTCDHTCARVEGIFRKRIELAGWSRIIIVGKQGVRDANLVLVSAGGDSLQSESLALP